jgi:hypothetical protein
LQGRLIGSHKLALCNPRRLSLPDNGDDIQRLRVSMIDIAK